MIRLAVVVIYSVHQQKLTSLHQLVEYSKELTCIELSMKQKSSQVHGSHDYDVCVPCAVCHVSNRTAVYMVPAKYTCLTG